MSEKALLYSLIACSEEPVFTGTADIVYSEYLQRQCNFNPFFGTGCYVQVHEYLSASVGPFSNDSKITELFFPTSCKFVAWCTCFGIYFSRNITRAPVLV